MLLPMYNPTVHYSNVVLVLGSFLARMPFRMNEGHHEMIMRSVSSGFISAFYRVKGHLSNKKSYTAMIFKVY